MNKVFFALISTFLTTGLFCTNISNQGEERSDFFVETFSRDSSGLISVYIESIDTLDELPKVTVNKSLPDTVSIVDGRFQSEFRNVQSNSPITYTISIGDDSVQNQFTIPGEIDSVFCNGVFLNDLCKGGDPNIGDEIDPSSEYVFSWKTKHKGAYFSVEYCGDTIGSETNFLCTTDTSLTITPDDSTGLASSELRLQFENCFETNYDSKTDGQINGIRVYYSVQPPRYICYVRNWHMSDYNP